MRAVLTRMDELAAPDASERARLAESWEQLGRQDKAVEVLEKLRDARGPEDFSSDLETRLAWLYSETGAEEKAYDAWKSVWLRIDSPGRRRYIEDRFMATASRLGKLADIAIELEEKLAEGTADKRDSALLVRLYTKVGDPVSASEIIHDFMKQSGGAEIKMLEEQARVYVMCNDYYHYEKTLRKLMELDPEGTPEYLTQLAMSALERGRNDEARDHPHRDARPGGKPGQRRVRGRGAQDRRHARGGRPPPTGAASPSTPTGSTPTSCSAARCRRSARGNRPPDSSNTSLKTPTRTTSSPSRSTGCST